MATMRDVARRAEVSVGTASQALSGRGVVGEGTRARVAEAARELGYRVAMPRTAAQRPTLGLCMRARECGNPYTGFLYRIVSSVVDAAGARGFSVVVRTLQPHDKLPPELASPGGRDGLAGVIFYTLEPLAPGFLAPLAMHRLPVVLLGDEDAELPHVTIDNRGAEAQVVEYLLGLGHERITYATPHQAPVDGLRRQEGYLRAMGEAGLAPTILDSVGLLTALAPRPTAIACFDDNTAIAAIRALESLGLSVPHDVSVVGFGNLPEVVGLYPGLATVRHPVEEHARVAVRVVCDTIDGVVTAPSRTELRCTLLPGSTVAPCTHR